MPYIPHTPDDLQEMLSVVGVRTLDDLFADKPRSVPISRTWPPKTVRK